MTWIPSKIKTVLEQALYKWICIAYTANVWLLSIYNSHLAECAESGCKTQAHLEISMHWAAKPGPFSYLLMFRQKHIYTHHRWQSFITHSPYNCPQFSFIIESLAHLVKSYYSLPSWTVVCGSHPLNCVVEALWSQSHIPGKMVL